MVFILFFLILIDQFRYYFRYRQLKNRRISSNIFLVATELTRISSPRTNMNALTTLQEQLYCRLIHLVFSRLR